MKNKEQLLYFFLQGKISLSQYDYKFMANLQTMIQNQSRVTSNQATLFDNLISKYKKQLTKQGFVKEELKLLPWKTMVVESTSEYTGAVVTLTDDEYIEIRVPFNKTFIGEFRNVKHNNFEWNRDTKTYRTPFSTNGLKIASHTLPKFFSSVRYCDELQDILNELKQYEGLIWNPTLTSVNGTLTVAAINEVLGEKINDIELSLEPKTIFNLARMGITIDQDLYKGNEKLKFAANYVHEIEIDNIETIISWMKNIGCENVIIGRAMRSITEYQTITNIVEKYGMTAVGPMGFGKLPTGVSMLLQNTSSVDNRAFTGYVSKIILVKDSRPIEVL